MKKYLISAGLVLLLNPIVGLAVAPVEDYSESATEIQDEGISFSRSSSEVAAKPIPERLRVLESKVDNLSQANLTARIEELQQTIAELRGQLEKQSHDLELVTANQKSFYEDINNRLGQSSVTSTASASAADAAASASTPAAAPSPASASPSPAPKSVASDEPPADQAPVKPSISARIKASSIGNVKTAPAAKSVPTAQNSNNTAVSESELYQQAFSSLKSKQYDRALTQFKEYITKYPKGNYAVNAHFWTGEINYLKGKHSVAKKSFETVVKNYPKDKKIPDAMLKLAIIATDTGHKSQAEEMLTQIQKQYPGTTAARLAMIRAQELRLSTH